MYLDAVGSKLYEGTSIALRLKKGDTLIIMSAKDFKNGTSGFTSTIIFGEVPTGRPPQVIPFEFYREKQYIEETNSGTLVFTFNATEWKQVEE